MDQSQPQEDAGGAQKVLLQRPRLPLAQTGPGVAVHEEGRPEAPPPVGGDLHALAPYPRPPVRPRRPRVDADVGGAERVEAPGDLLPRAEEVVSVRVVVRVASPGPSTLLGRSRPWSLLPRRDAEDVPPTPFPATNLPSAADGTSLTVSEEIIPEIATNMIRLL